MGSDDLDVDLVAEFDLSGGLTGVTVFLDDAKWNYRERVQRLQGRHHITAAEAEGIVRAVIAEKEHGPGEAVAFSTRSRSRPDCVLLDSDDDF